MTIMTILMHASCDVDMTLFSLAALHHQATPTTDGAEFMFVRMRSISLFYFLAQTEAGQI